MKTPLSYEDWVVIGKRLKFVKNEITSLLCDTRLQDRMTKKQMTGFSRAHYGIMAVKSECEEAMYRDISDQYTDTHPLISVFYGEKEPTEPPKKLCKNGGSS
jgi:hypothetical protein